MDDTSDIPSDILNFNTDKLKQNKVNYKNRKKMSSFFLTINSNMGRKILEDRQQRIIEYRKFNAVVEKLIDQFKQGKFLKQFKEIPLQPNIQVIYEKHRIEIGEIRNGLHVHISIGFDSQCLIDTRAIHDYFKTYYKSNPKIQSKYIEIHGKASIEDYIDKNLEDVDNNEINKTQPLPTINNVV